MRRAQRGVVGHLCQMHNVPVHVNRRCVTGNDAAPVQSRDVPGRARCERGLGVASRPAALNDASPISNAAFCPSHRILCFMLEKRFILLHIHASTEIEYRVDRAPRMGSTCGSYQNTREKS